MHPVMALLMIFPVVLVACFLPWMGRSRRGVLFGVTLPLGFAESNEAQAALRRYRLRTVLIGLVAILGVLLVATRHSAIALTVSVDIAIGLELMGAWLMWQSERRAMKPHAILVPMVRSGDLLPSRQLGGLYASASALLPLAVVGGWLQLHWDSIPARWAKHWNANFQADGWGTKTTVGVFFPLLVGIVIVVMMTAMAALLALGSGPQSRQRRLAIAPIAGLSWLMAATFCGIGLLPMRHQLSSATIVTVVAVQLVVAFGLAIWLVWRSGMMEQSVSAELYDSTPDASWHGGGLVYYNPGDAAVIVPKRYGFGWTLNFARPLAWLSIGGILLTLTLIGVVPLLMRK